MVQDQAPPTDNIEDDQLPKINLDKSTVQFSNSTPQSRMVMGTRRFDRPTFLSECFEEPEPQYFYMFKECPCAELKLAEIKQAFTMKHSFVLDNLRCITKFFHSLSLGRQELS